MTGGGQHIPDITKSRYAEKAGFGAQDIRDFSRGITGMFLQIKWDHGIKVARPGGHGQSFERREAHARIHRLAMSPGGDTIAGTKMNSDSRKLSGRSVNFFGCLPESPGV